MKKLMNNIDPTSKGKVTLKQISENQKSAPSRHVPQDMGGGHTAQGIPSGHPQTAQVPSPMPSQSPSSITPKKAMSSVPLKKLASPRGNMIGDAIDNSMGGHYAGLSQLASLMSGGLAFGSQEEMIDEEDLLEEELYRKMMEQYDQYL